MFSRRKFLQRSSIVSLAPVLPYVFGRTAKAANPVADDKVLVVIQLDGGNDGLNTVVPYADDAYGRARKKLRIPTKDVLKVDDQLGLHPAMRSAKELFDDGRLSIVQGVGYPNPDRSHFRSMKIWQTASFDDDQHDNNGWLGRTLDQKSFVGKKNAIYIGQQETPVALWGRQCEAVSLSREEDLRLAMDLAFTAEKKNAKADLEQFVSKQVLSAYASAEEFEKNGKKNSKSSDATYPNTRLGSQLKLVSQLLKSGAQTRVFYTSQNGYDTHSAQQFDHSRLLREYSDALKALLDDLKHAGLDDRVVVMTFSEFGRRIEENDSLGTDHGTAGPVFLAGSPIKGGLLGDAPDFSDLVDGDLKVQHDFRSIYATILDQWLDVDSASVLGGEHPALPIFG
jgi:uncharacterized protein (DUF1501 family)